MRVLPAVISLAAVALLGAGSNPPGPSFTAAQAAAGRHVYTADCLRCHGANLQGVIGPALKGGDSNLSTQKIGAVYTYVKTEMPQGNAGGLKSDEYVVVMAFLLQSNGHKAGSEKLTPATLSASQAPVGGAKMQ